MDKPSSDVLRIVDECLSGKLLGHKDAVRLCEIEAFTPDYYVLMYALRQLSYKASGGVAEVHGQIGMDANPCATGDCERYSWARGDVFGAIYRMMVGTDFMCFGSGTLEWAEVGTNPRDDKNETEKDGLGSSIYKVRLEFENKELKAPQGPFEYW